MLQVLKRVVLVLTVSLPTAHHHPEANGRAVREEVSGAETSILFFSQNSPDWVWFTRRRVVFWQSE